MDSEEYNIALKKMTYYLSVRDHSLKELHTKLSKNFAANTVTDVLEKAIANKWVSSPEEMAEKIKSSLDSKNKGFLFISQYLSKKGLPAVDHDEEIELEKACDILKQHFKLLENNELENLTNDQKMKAKRLLNNRGFENEVISKVIYEVY